MEECSEGLKSKIQWVKSVLQITSCTPMEQLLSSFEEFERSWMVTTASHSLLFFSMMQQPSPQPSPLCLKKSVHKRKQISLIHILYFHSW